MLCEGTGPRTLEGRGEGERFFTYVDEVFFTLNTIKKILTRRDIKKDILKNTM